MLEAGVEPARAGRLILSQMRLPFRHSSVEEDGGVEPHALRGHDRYSKPAWDPAQFTFHESSCTARSAQPAFAASFLDASPLVPTWRRTSESNTKQLSPLAPRSKRACTRYSLFSGMPRRPPRLGKKIVVEESKWVEH